MDNVIAKLREALNASDKSTRAKLTNGAMIELRELDRDAYGEALSILTGSRGNKVVEVVEFLENYNNNLEEKSDGNFVTRDELMRQAGIQFASPEAHADLRGKAAKVVKAMADAKKKEDKKELKEEVEFCLVLPTVKSDEEANEIVELLKSSGIESYYFSR